MSVPDRSKRCLAAAALLALLASGARAAAPEADWPHWRGPSRNGVTPESSGWPAGWPPKRLWSRNVGRGCTSPIVVGERLYTMGWTGRGRGAGTDTVFCLEARTGRELWTQAYPCRYQGRVRTGDEGAYGGPSSTPAYDPATGYLYTLSTDGDLHCWDATQNGKPVWAMNLYDRYKAPQRPNVGGGRRDYGYPTSPLVYGDLLLVEVGAREGTVMAFDKRTGQRRWASQFNGPAGHTGGIVPIQVAGIDCLAVLALQHLLVLRADPGHEGRTLGTHAWATEFACNVPTPAVAGNRILVTSEYNHSASTLLEASPRGLRKVWTSKCHTVASSPVIYRDRIFMVNGALQCVDLATGRLLWRGGDFGNGSCLVTAGDHKVIAFGSRKVVLLEALPEDGRYRELSRLDRVVSATCYPHITLAHGILCCKDRDGNLVCFSVRPVPDTTPPEVASAFAAGEPTKLRVLFSEPVEKASAERVASYAVDYDVTIAAAELGRDRRTVTLTVSPLREGGTYTLTVRGVQDCAQPPNPLAGTARARFRFTPTRRVVEGLVALYTFEEGEGTTVRDLSGVGEPLSLRLADPRAAKWEPGALAITAPAAIESAGPASKIIDACLKTHEITIEAWLKPENTRQNGPARIVSLSKDPYFRNFTLGQEGGAYDVRLRTTRAGENGSSPSTRTQGGVATDLAHVVYTRDRSGKAKIIVNAAVQAERAIEGDLGNWDDGFRFALANELTHDRPWLGELHLVAIYARALTQQEVEMNHRAGPEGGTGKR